MNGTDLWRRIERLRADAKARGKLAVLWRKPAAVTTATAAECVGNAREPLRRLEPLRRAVSA